MSEIEIQKITIKMGKKEVELTIEQARELKAALGSLLGETVTERVIEKYPYHYDPYRWVWTSPRWDGQITYTSDNTASYSLSLNT